MVWLSFSIAAVLVAAIDQVSKAIVLSHWRPSFPTFRRPFVSIQCFLNRRGALVRFIGLRALVVVWAATVGLTVLALAYGAFGQRVVASIGFGALIGGATGNLLDRVRREAIVDFIAVGPWPIFNLADAAIVVGIGLVLLSLS
jgi:signal peptidase II